MRTDTSLSVLSRWLLLLAWSLVFVGTGCESEEPGPDLAEENPDSIMLAGGSLTQKFGFIENILLQYPPTLLGLDLQRHREGAGVFIQTYVPNGQVHPGLGPVYISQSCYGCHVNAGRGRPVNPGELSGSAMMLHISGPGTGPLGGPDTVPGFGVVLQPQAINSVQREGSIYVFYRPMVGSYGDGASYELRDPTCSARYTYVPLPPGTLFSSRIASPLIGLGLLESVPDAMILEWEDPNDGNGDGISGRVNRVQNVLTNTQTIGRFGWKAGFASVYERIAFDYNQGMGVTSSLPNYVKESCIGQPQAQGANFDDPEVQGSESLRPLTTYLKTTSVPGRRSMNDPTIRRGQKLFTDGGCALCHRPQLRTGDDPDVNLIDHQTFYPYTDLLLHDMGDGLADNRPDFKADGREWRTAPLWGIGLTDVINGNTYFLHDGRARTLEEAIIWHGGEAEKAKQFFVTLPKSDRDALVAFLRSL